MGIWRIARPIFMLHAMVFAKQNHSYHGSSPQQQITLNDTTIKLDGGCAEWTKWIPPRINPAIVVQAISTDYADVQRNFIELMETRSHFSRDNLYLMCLDTQTVEVFRAMHIHCISVQGIQAYRHHDIWKLRVTVVGCLLASGFDVLLSDADALWVDDPMQDLGSPRNNESSIIASRGLFPFPLGRKWGSTMCMGFALFRASGLGMLEWQHIMGRIVGDTGDDQIALNNAGEELGIVWDTESDMRYVKSTREGRGVVPGLSTAKGVEFSVVLLPHSRYTRICSGTLLSNETVVAHCISRQKADDKTLWMQEKDLWFVENNG